MAYGDNISRQQEIDLTIGLSDDSVDFVRAGIKALPPAQPEITRCKDCKHFDPIYTGGAGVCEHWHAKTENNVYCTYAERRTNG